MMYLSRLTLSRAPSVDALAALLNPADQGRRLDAHHRMIWSAFAGDPEARRDFLWRDEGNGRFLVLSPRAPDTSMLFGPPQVREFAPDLRAGDRVAFLLRANATRSVKTHRITPSGKRERNHQDVVMHALHLIPKGARAQVRMALAQEAGRAWLASQGARSGFAVEDASVTTYRVIEARRNGPRFGVIDIEGVIEVADPPVFLARLSQGFGRAKAFGCGLMLIKRA